MKTIALTIFLLAAMTQATGTSKPRSEIIDSSKTHFILDSLKMENEIQRKSLDRYQITMEVLNINNQRLNNAYTPISVLTGVIGVAVGIFGIVVAFIIYLLSANYKSQIGLIMDEKSKEIGKILKDQNERITEVRKTQGDLIEKHNVEPKKEIHEYTSSLKTSIDDLKKELSSANEETKKEIKKKIYEFEEKIAEAPLKYGTSSPSLSGATGIQSALGYGIVPMANRTVLTTLSCPNCENKNNIYAIDRILGKKNCDKCGYEFTFT